MAPANAEVLKKIKKCLALGGSSEPHEAAAALARAQALMREHKVTLAEVELGEIVEEPVRSIASATKTKSWELLLVGGIASAFGCELMFRQNPIGFGWYIFVGPQSEVDLAKYTTVVLQRALRKARTRFVAENSYLDRADKTREADAYCAGWVVAVTKKVNVFARPKKQEDLLKQYIDERAEDGEIETQHREGGSLMSLFKGQLDAQGVDLRRPLEETRAEAAQLPPKQHADPEAIAEDVKQKRKRSKSA